MFSLYLFISAFIFIILCYFMHEENVEINIRNFIGLLLISFFAWVAVLFFSFICLIFFIVDWFSEYY